MGRTTRRSAKNLRQIVGKARSKRTKKGRKSARRIARKTKSHKKSVVKQLTETLTLPKDLSETLSSILQGPKKSVKGKGPVIQMETSSEPVKKKSKNKSKKKKKTKAWQAKVHGKGKKGKKKHKGHKKKKMKGGSSVPVDGSDDTYEKIIADILAAIKQSKQEGKGDDVIEEEVTKIFMPRIVKRIEASKDFLSSLSKSNL